MFVLRVAFAPSILNKLNKLLPPSTTRRKIQHTGDNKDPRQHQAIVRLVGRYARNRSSKVRRCNIQRAIRSQIRLMRYEFGKRLQSIGSIVKFSDRFTIVNEHQCRDSDYSILSIKTERDTLRSIHIQVQNAEKKEETRTIIPDNRQSRALTSDALWHL